MANQYVNKVIYGGNTLIDLTADTVSAQYLLSGYTAHDRSGASITGTMPSLAAATADATAVAAEILAGETAYANGAKVTGSMPNIGAQTIIIDDVDDEISITLGYHDGSGKAKLDATEAAKIKNTANIKSGVTILGITGTYSGGTVTVQSKSATPTTAQQTIIPDSGYDYLSQVTIAAIPYVETDNSAGGKTVTIAGTV